MYSCFPFVNFKSFNSPLGVLFIFPSRYLSTIGLVSIFFRGWRLPPLLRSTSKERDSFVLCWQTRLGIHTGQSPSSAPSSKDLNATPDYCIQNNAHGDNKVDTSHCGIFSLRSPLLRESLLVTPPSLNNMLKLSE